MEDDLQLSLLQSALKVSSNEVYAPQLLLSTGWKVLGDIPASVQSDIHALVPLLALVLFGLVIWIFIMIINNLPADWYAGGQKGESPRRERERLPDESPPVDGSPVCASLTFPRSEARFKICGDNFRNGKRLDILGGNSGRALLVASFGVTKDEGQSALRISYPNCETDPRCSIQVTPDALGYDALVMGRKDALYGTLEKSQGSCLVRHNELPSLKAEVNRITLVAVVTSPHGRPLAKGSMEPDGYWHLQVEPKADALLILATILAAVRLWRPSEAKGSLTQAALERMQSTP